MSLKLQTCSLLHSCSKRQPLFAKKNSKSHHSSSLPTTPLKSRSRLSTVWAGTEMHLFNASKQFPKVLTCSTGKWQQTAPLLKMPWWCTSTLSIFQEPKSKKWALMLTEPGSKLTKTSPTHSMNLSWSTRISATSGPAKRMAEMPSQSGKNWLPRLTRAFLFLSDENAFAHKSWVRPRVKTPQVNY